MRDAGWRLLLTPAIHTDHGLPYAIDNGAWGAYMRQEEWQEGPFLALLESHGEGADWVVAPDIVAGGLASLDRSREWIPSLLEHGRVLVPVQDGMRFSDLRDLFERYDPTRVGIFIGGTTEWKLATLPGWGSLCQEIGAWCHVGRVNTVGRINLCHSAGAHSFDGTSVTRYAKTIGFLDAARRQSTFFDTLDQVDP